MANLVDKSGDATSNLVRGGTTTSLSFSMPGNVPLDVESVVATIDNSAGAATTPTLVVRDSSGEVIATKRMDDTIPAGDTGTATFSLRNAGKAVGIRYNFDNEGEWLTVTATGADFFGFGIDLAADAGIRLAAHGGTVGIEFGNYNAIQNGGSGDYFITCGSYSLNSQDLALIAAGGEIDVTASGTFTTGNVTVALAIGETLTVQNHLGQPIFRVNEDGSLQGKTGKALTFNL
jgi:hypothetical protein